MNSAQPKSAQLCSLIAERAIRILFQPIVDLNDGMIVAYEALCRPNPESGFASADELFDAADECGMLWELENATRGAAMETAADWPRDIRLFLNSSPSVFADDRFADALKHDIRGVRGLAPDQIVLEITERCETKFDDRLLRQANLAKGAGFNVAIDDAGAGTSGLNRMMQIRPHWIKLDRQLVAGINDDAYRQNLIRFFVHFARMSGVNVIAEGIENSAELATLMGLGVRYGQGYFLARPADRSETMDAGAVARVRERWASVEASLPLEPHSLPMVRLCTSVLVIENGLTPIAEAAAQLSKNPDFPGLVVTEGRRLIGWVDRRDIMSSSLQTGYANPITSIARPAACALSPDATVREALRFVCSRDDEDLSQPLIIAAGAEIVGVVSMRDLLRAAATEARDPVNQESLAAGLPHRARADQHLEQMIARAQNPAQRLGREFHHDAAFIDIRRFADYNGVFGYDMGDRLIRSLAEQISSCVVRSGDEVFLAHLGDDRFMLTAREGILEARFQLLLQNFAKLSSSLTAPSLLGSRHPAAESGAGGSTCVAEGPSLGLRVLFLPNVFERVGHPREIYRLEQQLRQKARGQEKKHGSGASMVVVDDRAGKARVARRSA
ncbi:MAG TPA: EAL domain-containing protein [Phycisphaerales bacterium]|jgi:EAL domain-containing protein (putative c-di-GMP-specific phosphodiesterase class I)/GGDEF domain-containing protein|nr:EAL domain-containing protein [Phycisphaerales bacterium]